MYNIAEYNEEQRLDNVFEYLNVFYLLYQELSILELVKRTRQICLIGIYTNMFFYNTPFASFGIQYMNIRETSSKHHVKTITAKAV